MGISPRIVWPKEGREIRLRKAVLALSTFFLLISLCQAVACGGGTHKAALIQNVPKDITDFITADIKALRKDHDFTFAYESWKESFNARLSKCGIKPDDVDAYAEAWGTLFLAGRFDVDTMRDRLADRGYTPSQWGEDVATWAGSGEMIVIDKNLVIMGGSGPVGDCLNVMKYHEDSLGDDRDVRDATNRLSGGLVIGVVKRQLHPGLKAAAFSAQKTGKDTCRITLVYKFKDDESAKTAKDAVEHNEPRRIALKNASAKQHGEYIILTGDTNASDLFLPWGTVAIIV